MTGLDLDRVRELFDASQDFTVGIEEEFALLNPDSLDLVQRFEQLQAAAQGDPVLADAVAGELISSEVEIRSGRGRDFADAVTRQREARARLFALATDLGIALGATGTHPWSPWQEQRIIGTEHYRRVQEGLQYVARRNNTFSLHVHVGIRGADRAVAVCDRLRLLLPELLALSANSPFLEGEDSGLHTVRTQIFTKSFPRCGIPEPFGDFASYQRYVEFLVAVNSIVETTQLWWSVRPHHSFGTVEVRICDCQSRGEESFALAALMVACTAQAALDHDAGIAPDPVPPRLVEENFWRAIRHGLEGAMIALPAPHERPTRAALEALWEWAAPARAQLGLDQWLEPALRALDQGNGSQRQRREAVAGVPLTDVYRETVEQTRASYVPTPAELEGVAPR